VQNILVDHLETYGLTRHSLESSTWSALLGTLLRCGTHAAGSYPRARDTRNTTRGTTPATKRADEPVDERRRSQTDGCHDSHVVPAHSR
jgi:hypothetical protein